MLNRRHFDDMREWNDKEQTVATANTINNVRVDQVNRIVFECDEKCGQTAGQKTIFGWLFLEVKKTAIFTWKTDKTEALSYGPPHLILRQT